LEPIKEPLAHRDDQLTTRLRSTPAQGIAAEMSPNEPFFELYRWKALAAARRSLAIAVGYAKFFSRSRDALIRVYEAAGNVIETHEQAGEFREL
jgi:hypothetical protein